MVHFIEPVGYQRRQHRELGAHVCDMISELDHLGVRFRFLCLPFRHPIACFFPGIGDHLLRLLLGVRNHLVACGLRGD